MLYTHSIEYIIQFYLPTLEADTTIPKLNQLPSLNIFQKRNISTVDDAKPLTAAVIVKIIDLISPNVVLMPNRNFCFL